MHMYAEVLFPSAPMPFTYAVGDVAVGIGDVVEAPFRKKLLPGLIVGLHSREPSFGVSGVTAILQTNVLVPWQVEVLLWIVEYYAAHAGRTAGLFVPNRVWDQNPLKRLPKIKKQSTPQPREHTLNAEQEAAVSAILAGEEKPFLLHGVTGSGKTEVYLRVLQDAIARGKQAILLVPEIALTPQLTQYFSAYIPQEQVAVIHSGLAEGVRFAAWQRIASGDVRLIIGSRSALFAPARELGVLILDEEHEWTYKNDNSPHYHARAVAQKIAQLTGARLILGSATPSFETYSAARSGRVQLLSLPHRANASAAPKVQVIDLRRESASARESLISTALAEAIALRLERKEQVILLHNRRGFSSAIVCETCGESPYCPQCDIALTHHRNAGKMLCHSCGYSELPPRVCSTCGSEQVVGVGMGTQKLEEALLQRFPTVRLLRADRDSTTKVGSHEEIFRAFRAEEADILIGTQMIAKGLDMPNVTLAAVTLADSGLHIPDFRAGEKTFSLLTQLAGRPGRAGKVGEVIIQTFSPDHPALRSSARHEYVEFYEAEMRARREFRYPPYVHMVKYVCEAKTERDVLALAEALAKELTARYPGDSVTRAPPMIPRQGERWQWYVLWRGRDPRVVLSHVTLPKDCTVDVDPISVV